ncbi:MAG: DUF4350 domain-containing protein [Ginsengibacter sp.]
MRAYKNFIIIFSSLFILYIIAELNKPKAIDWTVTIGKNDKNPYGGYIIYNQLKDLFPAASVNSYDLPVYNQLNNITEKNTAYMILTLSFEPSKYDYREMMQYINQGNYILVSAENFGKGFLDSLKLETSIKFSIQNKDSAAINFVNPLLKSKKAFTFLSFTMDQYFSKLDTARTTVLGVNDKDQPDFIKIAYGKGALLVHAAPICFSNYFMLFANNATYTGQALSYVPGNVSKIYWDEYYKPGNQVSSTPLRFFLNNEYLRWALYLALAGLMIYVFFQMKRRQRVIPVITPLENSSLDFVKTVSGVYFNQKDNNSIAHKKLSYFLDFVRRRFYLPTGEMDQSFIEQLARKSGVAISETTELVNLLRQVETPHKVSDRLLLMIDQHIDNFYKQI